MGLIRSMGIDRRHLLIGAGASLIFPSLSWAMKRAGAEDELFLSGIQQEDGSYAVVIFNKNGDHLVEETLNSRGHGGAYSSKNRHAVIFARRPGRFALVFDLTGQLPRRIFTPPADRHFYGHGFYSPDGTLLYASENDYSGERGVIGIYAPGQNYSRVGEIETYGIGPHEIVLMPDGETICVANGGILTHPDYPREKLNLSSMEPSLCYINRSDGALLERKMLSGELRQLSIRHLAVAGEAVWFGCQYEGYRADDVPLVGTHTPGDEIRFIRSHPAATSRLNHYVGSLAVSGDSRKVAVTSPRGNRVLVWDAASQTLLRDEAMSDVCGIAFSKSGLIATSSTHIKSGRGDLIPSNGRFDNHITAL